MDKEQKETLGECIKRLRAISGLTLRQIEEATGISNAYLSQLENGKIKMPSVNYLYKLASLLGVELDVFLFAAGIITEPRPALPTMNLTPDEERQILDYLEFLRRKK